MGSENVGNCSMCGGPCACFLDEEETTIEDINEAGACSHMSDAINQCLSLPALSTLSISASELMKAYPNLSLGSIGVMLLTNVMHGKMDIELDTIAMLRSTSKKMRQDIMKGNVTMMDQLKKVDGNKNVGINPSGQVYPVKKNEKNWWRFLFVLLAVLVIIAAGLLGGVAAALAVALGLVMATSIAALAIQMIMESDSEKIDKSQAEEALIIINALNPAYDVADILVTASVELACWATPGNADKHRQRGEIAKGVLSAVITVAAAIALSYITAGATSVATATMIANTVSGFANGTLAIVRGVFSILKGIKEWETAKEVFTYKELQAVIESQREALENLSSIIDAMIEGLNTDSSILATEFARASGIVKLKGETNVTIARNITI